MYYGICRVHDTGVEPGYIFPDIYRLWLYTGRVQRGLLRCQYYVLYDSAFIAGLAAFPRVDGISLLPDQSEAAKLMHVDLNIALGNYPDIRLHNTSEYLNYGA